MKIEFGNSARTALGFARLVALCAAFATCGVAQAPKGFEAAAAAFDRGDFPQAERSLREALARAPDEPFGLNLLAVTLDREEKYQEAGAVYGHALRLGPNPALLNNLANHYRATGQKDQAYKYYFETLRLDPHHSNANYQLAVLDVAEHKPVDALKRLGAMPSSDQSQAAVVLLKGQAKIQSGQADAAKRTLAALEASVEADPAVAFSLGVMYYQEKLYGDAVRCFEAALRRAPGNFDALYNLGLAYDREGQRGRAAEVLGRALRLNPRSADALYHLAGVLAELGRDEGATDLLIRAREVAPDRPEIALALAHECVKQEFWLDAVEAYENYLRLSPQDWEAHKEVAFLDGQVKYYVQALPHLDAYVAARPKDPEGFYLRGLILWHLKRLDPAAEDLGRALKLDPRRAEAWARLGEIAREKNDSNQAERDFRKALEVAPAEPNSLYGLGQLLNNRGEYTQAVPLLEKAIQGRADEPALHYQLSVAYHHLGREDQARAELEKFQGLHEKSEGRRYFRTGLVAYLREGLKLSDAERQSRQLSYLERAAAIKPGDAGLHARLIEAYLAAGKKAEAQESIRQLLETDSNGQAALRVGELFAARGDDETAEGYLRQADQNAAVHFAARMDLAEAEFRLGRYAPALELLQGLDPQPDAAVEYQLERAAILDRLGRYNDALTAYQQAIRLDSRQEGSYLELGLFFTRHAAYDAALENFRAAEKLLPQSLRLALAEAIVLNLATHREESYAKLQEIERRWPEQDLPCLLAGISAYTAYRTEDARREFEKAAALESTNPLAYYYLALLESQAAQPSRGEALRWAEMAVEGDPGFAPARFLLGELYKNLGKTDDARRNLEEAVRLQPNLAEAHYLLGQIYAESGDDARARAEREESVRLHREVHYVSPDQENIQRLLVDIGLPRR